MLRQILDQMQFKVEGTGGGCEAMTLYTHGHAVVVSLDAQIDFSGVTSDDPISIGVYSGASAYNWGDDNMVDLKHGITESDAINHVIEALLLAERLGREAQSEIDEAMYSLWVSVAKSIGRPESCANEIDLRELNTQDAEVVTGYRALWWALSNREEKGDRVKNGPLQPKLDAGVSQ